MKSSWCCGSANWASRRASSSSSSSSSFFHHWLDFFPAFIVGLVGLVTSPVMWSLVDALTQKTRVVSIVTHQNSPQILVPRICKTWKVGFVLVWRSLYIISGWDVPTDEMGVVWAKFNFTWKLHFALCTSMYYVVRSKKKALQNMCCPVLSGIFSKNKIIRDE